MQHTGQHRLRPFKPKSSSYSRRDSTARATKLSTAGGVKPGAPAPETAPQLPAPSQAAHLRTSLRAGAVGMPLAAVLPLGIIIGALTVTGMGLDLSHRVFAGEV